jgi:hypothetical protein
MRDVGKAMRVDEMNRHRKTPLRTVVDRAVIASTPEDELRHGTFVPRAIPKAHPHSGVQYRRRIDD